jgi:hypothetical protein
MAKTEGSPPMKTPKPLLPLDPLAALEQQLAYRVHAYLTNQRRMAAEFTLPGLRDWMLCQTWPVAPERQSLECLAVLAWSAVCQADGAPDQEAAIRQGLIQQLDFLGGISNLRPSSLEIIESAPKRTRAYQELCSASAPGSAGRVLVGLPRASV